MYRSIMVPLNGSTFGEHALPLALSIARRSGAELHLVHVHTPLQAAYAEIQLYDATLDTHLRERERLYLEGLAKRIMESSNVRVAIFNKMGDIAPTLRDHVHNTGNDLVVMTTHGRGPMGRFWLGSTTDELIRDLPNEPMLLVHPGEGDPDLGQDVALKHFLIALDGTPLAEQILEPTLELGKVMNADYTLLRLVHPITPMDLPMGVVTIGHVAETMIEQIEKVHTDLEKASYNYLESIAQNLRGQGLRVQTKVALEEQAGLGILHQAQVDAADLIALETHGRRGLQRLFMGSVTSKVIRGSKLPILVHRPIHP
jgi:nucleotide-binding universal stress UspA family protein